MSMAICQFLAFQMPLQGNYYFWKSIGWGGLAMFNTRWIVQWMHSERKKQSAVPVSFWWQSLAGNLLCLAYALRQQDVFFILSSALTVVPYSRNLMLVYKKRRTVSAMPIEPDPEIEK
jgi:lipid-A-disaccharide synthase-like uncharacterized protein